VQKIAIKYLKCLNMIYSICKNMLRSGGVSAIITITSFFSANAQLNTYPAPAGAALNPTFTIKVRLAGKKEWQPLTAYSVKVVHTKLPGQSVENASMAYFSFDGTAEVSVSFNEGKIDSYRIRPFSDNIPSVVEGNTIRFTLQQPRNISIEINGDIFHNLHLFGNPLISFVPNVKDSNLIYYGPGIHEVAGGVLEVPSGKIVYLAGGAILKAHVVFNNVHDAKLIGDGMIDQSERGGISIEQSRNITVQGVFCARCFTGGSQNVHINNVKAISFFAWGDGMNVVSSNDVLIENVFNRNSDDCTTVYGTRGKYSGGCRNITMQHSTLWADVAHPILVGTHGSTPNKDTLQDLSYIDIDILDHNEAQIDYQGCMSLDAGDNNLIRNVRFENIRVDDFRRGQLLNLRVFFNRKYCTSPGRGIEDVLFKNIVYNGTHAGMSVIDGYNDERKIKNIVFENLQINGTVFCDTMKEKPGWYKTADLAGIYVGNHTENIVFKKTE